jgi:nicotinamide riboside kinase
LDGYYYDLNNGYTVHYFLCSPEDIDWQPDPLRENPNDRDRLFDIYEKELIFYKRDYTILRGNMSERLQTAFYKIDELLNNP